MNTLNKTLLAGAAVCALAIAPAVAENTSGFHYTALHGGRVVNKTKMPNHGATHLTYTFAIYSYAPASTPLHTKFRLFPQSMCPAPTKIAYPRKTAYGKLQMEVETYSNGCAMVTPIYKLIKQPGTNAVDSFQIGLSNKFEQNGTKYKGTLNLDYNLEFD